VTVAVFLALAVLVGAGSAALAWSQARRVAALSRGDPAALALALKRFPVEQRASELRNRAEPGSWEHELAAEVLAAPTDAAKVAAVNLALGEVEHALARGAGWPRASVRIALLGDVLLGAVAYLADATQVRSSFTMAGIGVVAALTCVEAARSAERNAAKRRRGIDELVAATFGDGLRAVETGPGRAGAGRRRRRG
jgi:hypothetical protein